LEPGGTITLTEKSFPTIFSTKYLKGAMLTVIILPWFLELGLHDITKNSVRRAIILFISLKIQMCTNLTLNITKGLCVANKIITATFETQ
jgi:hypothetical protein